MGRKRLGTIAAFVVVWTAVGAADAAALEQGTWRWYAGDAGASLISSDALAAENVPLADVPYASTQLRLRVRIDEVDGAHTSGGFTLWHSIDGAAWSSISTSSPVWKLYDGGGTAGGTVTGDLQLAGSTHPGIYVENLTNVSNGITANTREEMDFAIESNGAMAGKTYYFQVRRSSSSVKPPTGGEYPHVTILADDSPGDPTIDIMVVYTAAAAADVGGTPAILSRIDLAVAECNQSFANSQITQRYRLVHAAEVVYTETNNMYTDLDRLTWQNDGHLEEVHGLRDQYGADLVTMLTAGGQFGGLGWISSGAQTGFSVIRARYTDGRLLGHEMGHNMGCAHDRANAGSGGSYPYSYGYNYYGDSGMQWGTVMSYPGNWIPNFSNPDVLFDGQPTGVPVGEPGEAHNALTHNNRAGIVANFRESVNNEGPTASFTVSTDGRTVSVDGTGSSDPDGPILSWDWNFGDGSTATGSTASHTYAVNGTYTVMLTVADEFGETDVASQAVVAEDFVVVIAVSGNGLSAAFDGSGSTSPNGSIVSWDWDLGDGNVATGSQVSHTYAAAGTYTVTLTVTDGTGASASDATTFTAIAIAGGLLPVHNNLMGVTIDASSLGLDPTFTYDWDWGDGNASTGIVGTHTYAGAGDPMKVQPLGLFTVTLVVSTNDGGGGAAQVTVAPTNRNMNLNPASISGDPLSVDILDLSSMLAPYRRLGTGLGGLMYSPYWDLNPASISGGDVIDILDLSALLAPYRYLGTRFEYLDGGNGAPSITSGSSYTGTAGETLTFQVAGSDPDGDALWLAAVLAALPSGSTLDASGNFSWTPTAEQVGSYSFNVRMDDGRGKWADQTITIEVVAP